MQCRSKRLFFLLVVFCILILNVSCDKTNQGVTTTPTGQISFAPVNKSDQQTVVVDFGNKTGIPLFKRMNTFSTSHSFGGSGAAEFMRDVKLLPKLASENMRIDLFMGNGGIGGSIGTGTPDHMEYNFINTDLILKQLYKNGTAPYLCYFATPNALFQKETSVGWKLPPVDFIKWQEVCYEIAKHYRELGYPLAANEMWNEPDYYDQGTHSKQFYDGTWEEYLKIYEYGVKGIRQANPDATVGGLSLANISNYAQTGELSQFFDYTKEHQLPLDFISFHNYGTSEYERYIQTANEYLSRYDSLFSTTQLHMNEFHVVGWPAGKTPFKSTVVPVMFEAIEKILSTPSVTSVNWACFRESSEGLGYIDSRSGKRYAAYHALQIYNEMPVDRVAIDTKGYINGFASVGDGQAGIVLYNRFTGIKDVTVAMDHLPFEQCNVKIYAIDSTHSNYYDTNQSDDLEMIGSMENVASKNLSWKGEVAGKGTVYIKIEALDARKTAGVYEISDGKVISGGVAAVVRKNYYFPDRTKDSFAEFDLKTFTAYAGMGSQDLGYGLGGVVLENLPDSIKIKMDQWGTMEQKSKDSAAFLKIDYREKGGKVQKSIVYATDIFSTLPYIPWSQNEFTIQKIKPDQFFEIAISKDAPIDFSGQVVLSYGIKDCGKNSTAKFKIEKS